LQQCNINDTERKPKEQQENAQQFLNRRGCDVGLTAIGNTFIKDMTTDNVLMAQATWASMPKFYEVAGADAIRIAGFALSPRPPIYSIYDEQ
jgi:hypothetical protein